MERTLNLKTPIVKGERRVSELSFAEPKVKHILATDAHRDKNSYGADLSLASALTGEPESLLQEMAPEDWREVRIILALAYGRFMGLKEEEVEEVLNSPQGLAPEERTSGEA